MKNMNRPKQFLRKMNRFPPPPSFLLWWQRTHAAGTRERGGGNHVTEKGPNFGRILRHNGANLSVRGRRVWPAGSDPTARRARGGRDGPEDGEFDLLSILVVGHDVGR